MKHLFVMQTISLERFAAYKELAFRVRLHQETAKPREAYRLSPVLTVPHVVILQ